MGEATERFKLGYVLKMLAAGINVGYEGSIEGWDQLR